MSTNSFWRSTLDEFPGLHFLFNIDGSQNAHLFFVSKNIDSYLGFDAIEYVEKSEQDSGVKVELVKLVDEIASKSGEEESQHEGRCVLTSKSLHEISFNYKFKLFKNKQYPNPMIAVTMNRSSEIERDSIDSTREIDESFDVTKIGSDLIRQSWMRLINLTKQSENVLLIGEAGTGKEYLVKKLSRYVEEKLNRTVYFSLKPSYKENSLLILTDIDSREYNIDWDLLAKSKIQIFITGQKSIESLVEARILNEDAIYKIAWNTVVLAPLRKREKDADIIFEELLSQVSVFRHLDVSDVEKLRESTMIQGFPGNIGGIKHRFFRELAQIILEQSHSEELEFKGDLFGETSELANVEPYDIYIKKYLTSVLRKTHGKIYGENGAAKLLKLKPTTLQSKLKKFNVK